MATRRQFLSRGALLALSSGPRRTALGAVSISDDRSHDLPLLVTIFLRGGADGLSLVPPYGDDHYHRARPTLGISHPARPGVRQGSAAVNLNGYFGLHPDLAALYPLYAEGQLAVIPACGSGDETRSHFEAMATVERGLYSDSGPSSGWLARHLSIAPSENRSPLRAVAIGEFLPESLGGVTQASALRNASDLRLDVPFAGRSSAINSTLHRLYAPDAIDPAGLKRSGAESLAVLRTLSELASSKSGPANGAKYPDDDLGRGMQQVALLARSQVGLEVACLDHGSFDTHVAESSLLPGLLKSLAGALTAFAADLGPSGWNNTIVVVMSEFGRRVEENSGAGTDHGRGGVMLALGGKGINGGRVLGAWPGLAPESLDGPGDVRVVNDYRNVLAEILSVRLGNSAIDAVFPGLMYRPVGVCAR